ncbi:hypothetical protein [Cellvibrio sp. OA-2007]|uniref:hypothetical protein n=1 Tax=Cellvibrio sp. OA-2007 TaxID=529823 RepID=UPI00126A2CE2|nr:hypothetical protein [Cellvibrio sp. OA-2007]
MSLLLALSQKLHLQFRWSLIAVTIGTIGSWLLAHYAYEIADAMDGTGQELLNAALYSVVILSVIALGLFICPLAFKSHLENNLTQKKIFASPSGKKLIYRLCIVIVSFSLAREASEIWIYLSAFTHDTEMLSSALIGSAIGAGIGMSLGASTYYAFTFMQKSYFIPVFLAIITLLAGGLSMQIAKQLMQIGWLDSATPLWDSTFLVDEHSWVGELLYALIGYDSRPAPIQGIFYLLTITPVVSACAWHAWQLRVKTHE